MFNPTQLDPDLIWIRDVPREYGRSDTWWFQQVAAGAIEKEPRFPGDRRVYMRRSKIEKFLGLDRLRQRREAGD